MKKVVKSRTSRRGVLGPKAQSAKRLGPAVEDVRRLRAELGNQARIVAGQSRMIGRFQAMQAHAEHERAEFARRIEELEAEVSRLTCDNSSLATQLELRTTRTARLEADIAAVTRIVATSGAAAAARAGALQNELSAAVRRAAEMEASCHRANSELLAIKRSLGWRLLAPVRQIRGRVDTRANRRLIARSGLFDRDWYVTNCPDSDGAASDPLLDYLQRGAARGRDPSPLFSGGWYLEQYPDVRATGMNPLVHFLRYGAREGRNPSPFFETEWYCARYPDVRASGMNPLVHYLRYGAAEGRDPGSCFETTWYLATHPDVKALGFNPLAHYLEYGRLEGRRPNSTGRRPPPRDTQGQTEVVPPQPIGRYAAWLACNEFWEPALRRLRAELVSRDGRLPRISVVMPVYDTPKDLLDQAIRSVVDQVYERWELCIADDASTAPGVDECLAGRRPTNASVSCIATTTEELQQRRIPRPLLRAASFSRSSITTIS
jgi:Glycosyl transferase family 2